jgi:uncharacterized coiled-coil protein SlyX
LEQQYRCSVTKLKKSKMSILIDYQTRIKDLISTYQTQIKGLEESNSSMVEKIKFYEETNQQLEVMLQRVETLQKEKKQNSQTLTSCLTKHEELVKKLTGEDEELML